VSALIEKTSHARIFYGYYLAGYAFFVSFVASSFFLHSRGIFFPLWMQDFGVDRTQIALVISLTLFTGSCFAPITGWLIDRYPIKGILAFGCTWLSIGYCLMHFVDSYLAFFAVLLVFQGVGWDFVGPLVQTKLMVNWFNRNRGMALGIAIMGISVAGIIMPTVATYLSQSLGWQDTYLIYACIAFFLVLPLSLIVIKQDPRVINQYPDGDDKPAFLAGPQAAPPAKKSQGNVELYKEFLTSRPFWSVVITFGLMNGVYSAMITHLPTYLTKELSFDLYDASYVLGVAGAFAIAGKIAFGWLMDRHDAKRTVLAAVASYFSSTLVFMMANEYWLLLLAAALFGLGFGGMVPVRSVLLSRLFGIRKFSRVNGLLSFFLAPATFWVLITGYIADSTGSYVPAFQVWAAAFALAGLVTAVVTLPNREDAVL
jgi:MFS family permease